MPVGSYDPDEEESRFNKRPAYLTSKTPLQITVLNCCRRKYFADKPEFIKWKHLEEKTLGLTEEKVMFRAWIEFYAEWCGKKNAHRTVIAFPNLMYILENEVKRKDWIARNVERVMKERKNNLPTSVQKNRFQIESDEENGRNSS